MNKKTLITIVLAVILLGSGIAYLLVQKNSSEPEATLTTEPLLSSDGQVPNQPDQPVSVPDITTQAVPGSYQNYSAEAITNTSGNKLIFFHAPWCPQCRELEASIQAGTIPSNTTIFKTDYDTSQALRQRYGVTIQTTVVKVDDQGNLVDKFVAYDEPSLQAVVDRLL